MKAIFLLPFLLIHGFAFSQNLVLNGSFEDTLCSPPQFNTFSPFSAMHWYSPSTGTPDYFGDDDGSAGCYFQDINSAAFQQFGQWQYPKDGIRMAGIYTLFDVPGICIREYLQARLLRPLEAGQCHTLSFYVSLSNLSNRAHDRMGAVFTSDSVVDFTQPCLSFDQVSFVESIPGVILADTAEWMLVSGSFIAQGGEAFITIGVFADQNELEIETTAGFGSLVSAYYFVDHIELGSCSVSHIQEVESLSLHIYPNPAFGFVNFVLPVAGDLTIRDTHSRVIAHWSLSEGQQTCSLDAFAPGIYLATFTSRNGVDISKKFVVSSNW